MNLEREYEKWVKEGEPKDVNGSVPNEVKQYYCFRALRDYRLRVFIESGTSHGDTTAAMIPFADEIHTIEAYEESYNFARSRFKHEIKVSLYYGDSATILPRLVSILKGPAVFYLDAHWSGPGTAKLENPIIKELEVLTNRLGDVIIIDDARLFGVEKDWPSLDWILNFIKENFPMHEIKLEGDEIFILPK